MNKGDKIILKEHSYNAQKSTYEHSVFDDVEVTILKVNRNTYTVTDGNMMFKVKKSAI